MTSQAKKVSGEINYVPKSAIEESHRAKLVARNDRSKDPFNEDHVSPEQPSDGEVQTSVPDDTVRPG